MAVPVAESQLAGKLAVGFGQLLYIFSIRSDEQWVFDLNDLDVPPPKPTKENGKPEGGNETKKKDDPGSDESRICDLSFDPEGQYLVVATENKRILLWDLQAMKCIQTTTVPRKPMACLLCCLPQENSESENGGDTKALLVADKAGDVYSFPVPSLESDPVFMLRHTATIITDLCSDGQYLISADRDEKIRISHFPRTSQIKSFCLGHTDFVSAVTLLKTDEGKKYLVSIGGDFYVRVWDYVEGVELAKCQIGQPDTSTTTGGKLKPEEMANDHASLDSRKRKAEAEVTEGGEVVPAFLASSSKHGLIVVGYSNSNALAIIKFRRGELNEVQIGPNSAAWLSASAPVGGCHFSDEGLLLVSLCYEPYFDAFEVKVGSETSSAGEGENKIGDYQILPQSADECKEFQDRVRDFMQEKGATAEIALTSLDIQALKRMKVAEPFKMRGLSKMGGRFKSHREKTDVEAAVE